jgi:hypothetical protein
MVIDALSKLDHDPLDDGERPWWCGWLAGRYQ